MAVPRAMRKLKTLIQVIIIVLKKTFKYRLRYSNAHWAFVTEFYKKNKNVYVHKRSTLVKC